MNVTNSDVWDVICPRPYILIQSKSYRLFIYLNMGHKLTELSHRHTH